MENRLDMSDFKTVSKILDNKKIVKGRMTVESLYATYTTKQLTQLLRFNLVNDVQVNTKRDIERIIKLDPDSPELDYYYRLPRGVDASLGKYFRSTDFDCKCAGNCNLTELNKNLIQALHQVRLFYKHPITIVRGYECSTQGTTPQDLQHTKGCALTMESSNNDELYRLWHEKYQHYSLGRDDHFVYVNLNTRRDQYNNVAPTGYRWDNRSK